jgi:hypothetical protein
MLFALLYDAEDLIAAAAMACDQQPWGERFWQECHLAEFDPAERYQTAYMSIVDPFLQKQLMAVGIDQDVDRAELTRIVDCLVSRTPIADRAA